MAIRIPDLMEQVGFPELAGIGKEELATEFLPACIVGFSDGDLVALHLEERTDPEKIRLYGKTMFNQGEAAHKMLQVALANKMEPTPIYEFQAFAAEMYASPGGIFRQENQHSTTRVYPEAITIDNNMIALPRIPKAVVEYGACLASASMIDDQLSFIKAKRQPFVYLPFTRLHFTNQALLQEYDIRMGPGTKGQAMSSGLYVGREDGPAGATDEIITTHESLGVETEIADIIIYNAGNHAPKEDLKHAVTNAHKIVKEAGMFVVRSFGLPASDEIGTDEIVGWALDAGFEERTILNYDAVSHNVGAMILKGSAQNREIKTVVLTK